MTRPALQGVLAPIATPFDPRSGDVALDQFQDNAERLLGEGLSGLVVAGSTGEAALLERDEQRRLVATARAVVPSDKWLLVGTGAEATRHAVALTRDAAAEGADAVLVRPPGYFANALTPASLVAYYRAVADEGGLPVFVYNIPKFTHVAIAPAVLAELADHERIVGAKDSSVDPQNLAAYRAAVPRWTVLVGTGSLLFTALELGCEGGICGVACYAARLCVDLVAAYRAGDTAHAAAIQERVTAIDREIVGRLGPAGIKAAMEVVGLHGGPVRPPLAPLAAADRARVAAQLADLAPLAAS